MVFGGGNPRQTKNFLKFSKIGMVVILTIIVSMGFDYQSSTYFYTYLFCNVSNILKENLLRSLKYNDRKSYAD